MKMMKKAICAFCAMLTVTAVVSAKGFAKTQEYKEGQFTDVSEKQWYAADVKGAYELGFVNGKAENLYVPEGNVTVAEGITMATRVHSIYNGKTIAEKTGGKWYDMYIAYAEENGIVEKGQFSNFDRNIMRYEMALLFANAMPKEYFTAKNDIKDIPDVAQTEDYYDELMMLYKAGVVLGSDDYGNFYATNSIKRSETAAIINRVALPENRVVGALKEYGKREQAVYLINDYSMSRSPRGVSLIASGWTFENTGFSSGEKRDYSSRTLIDTSDTDYALARKTVRTQTGGRVVFEAILSISGDGAEILFEDKDANVLFGVCVEDGRYKTVGKTEKDTGVLFESENHRFYMILDLDTNKAELVLNGKELGTYEMSGAKSLSAVVYRTTKKDKAVMNLGETHLYVNYKVNDTFRTSAVGEKLYGWNTSGDVKVQKQVSDYDTLSAKITGDAAASKKFDALSGKFVFEAYVKTAEKGKTTLELKNDGKTAVSVEIAADKITSEGEICRQCDTSRWTLVRIEGDTEKGKALIRINGKMDGTQVTLNEKAVNEIVFTNKGTSLFFDDVQFYEVFDFADYVPKPVQVNGDGFNLGINVCSLWREGIHYGWDCISPYEEATPLLGYYDEGLPEVADWEIKFLAEHGYDFQNYCWYYYKGRFTDGIKEPTMGFALHDGYFNARYSDAVKFAIIWENGGAGNVTKEDFYNEIWPYWCEWYLSDSRYMTVDGKAVITILNHTTFIEHMGGESTAKEVVDFIRKDIKKLGYDDAVILSTVFGNIKDDDKAQKIGIDGFIAYHLGEGSYSAQHQIKIMKDSADNSKVPLLASCGMGLNGICWTENRVPLASAKEHESVFEWAKNEYLPSLAQQKGKAWMGNFAIANTWNEFGEGHYILPTGVNGFGYLDSARNVFSTVAGKDQKTHFDVEPTDNQKQRLGYLYTAQQTPMRRTYLAEDNTSVSDNKVIKSWSFENGEDLSKWESLLGTTTSLAYDEQEKALTAQTLSNDSHIVMTADSENHFKADDVRYIHIRMKTDCGHNTSMQVYYSTEEGFDWSADRCASAIIGENGKYVDYYIDMKGKSGWTGTVKALRFDPMQAAGSFYVRKIELISAKSQNGFAVSVNGTEYDFGGAFVKKKGDEVYIGANPSDGFYSLNGFYYQWNRFTGSLKIRTYTHHSFEFTLGSDKVLVDGVQKTLSSPIEAVDGLVMIPIMFIYDNGEYTYEKTGDGLKVTVRGIDTQKVLSERKRYSYDFNLPGDCEGWKIYGGIGAVTDDGVMYIEAISSDGKYSPHMVVYGTNIDTAVYNRVEVRFKPEYKDKSGEKGASVYFTTLEQPNADEAKKVKLLLDDYKPDTDGFYTITFDMASNELWRTEATEIRFDVPHRWGSYYIDYVKVLPFAENITDGSLSSEGAVGEIVKALDFSSKEKFMIFNVADLAVDGTFRGKGSNADPNGVYREKLMLDAKEISAIKIEAKIPKGFPAEIYFTTEQGNNFSADNRYKFTSDSDEMKTYVIYTSTNKNWKGTIYEVRLDFVAGADCAGLDFEWKSVEFCKAGKVSTGNTATLEAVSALDFSSKEKFMIFNVADLAVDGTFRGKGSNADPNGVYREKLMLDAKEISAIKIEAKIPKGFPAEIYFTTEQGNNFSADNRYKFTSDSDEMKTYVIYTSTNKNWKGTIYEVRLDFVAGADCAGLDFEWKSVEFCK